MTGLTRLFAMRFPIGLDRDSHQPLCYYILDLSRGAPNVPPGAAFDAIVADFRCPDCGTDRSNFRPYQADATLASSA